MIASKSEIKKSKLRVGDEVVVISGKAKRNKGHILAIDFKSGKIIVQGVNLRKRFAPRTQENPRGGIVEIEASIQISNVQFWDAKAKKRSRLRIGTDKNGKKVRIAVVSGKDIV